MKDLSAMARWVTEYIETHFVDHNGLLGVPEEKLFDDYELSSLSRFPRHHDIDYFKKWRAKIATYAPAGASVQEQVEKYLLAIGVTADEINSIRTIMLEK